MFRLSQRSFQKLAGVDEALQETVKLAIQKTKIDFGVICGMRTVEEQEALVAKGASKTMKSKHLEGKAVDLMAYIDGRASWELNLYDEIEVDLRWGASWHINSMREQDMTSEAMMTQYIDLRRSQGRRPFIDAPHFELT
jgi:peptidoglycan L-alanyl-D-glutamate endopeptidase CwlK